MGGSLLKVHDGGGKLLDATKYSAKMIKHVKVDGRLSESFEVGMGERCVMSPWLFNISRDGEARQMKARMGRVGAKLKLDRKTWL